MAENNNQIQNNNISIVINYFYCELLFFSIYLLEERREKSFNQ